MLNYKTFMRADGMKTGDNAVMLDFTRRRRDGVTQYEASVSPVMRDGAGCYRYVAPSGYRRTLTTCTKASKKAETEARAQAEKWVPLMVAKVCEDAGGRLSEPIAYPSGWYVCKW